MTDTTFQHLYGVMDGIMLSVIVLLFLFAIKNFRSSQDSRVGQTYILLAISFIGFEGFNIFLQSAHQASTAGFYPSWLVKLGSLTVPISLAILTYFYGHAMGLYSYTAAKALRRVRWMTRFIYASYVVIFLILLLSSNITMMVQLLVFSFVIPCSSGAYVAWKSIGSNHISKLIAVTMTLLVIGNVIMLWYAFGDRMLGKRELMVAVHLSYGMIIIIICHILLSMGRDELLHVFKRYSMDAKHIIHDIPPGLNNNEFSLQYQPQLDLSKQRISGIEALIRWNHPIKGNIPPNDFIPIAEETGLIQNLTMWVIEQSLKDTKKLIEKGLPLNISINFSPNCFTVSMVTYLEKQLKRFAVPSELVIIEITENMMIKEEDPEVQSAFAKLHKMGIQLSIDDYGTGFSSLSYLKKMHVRELKIDQSFIRDLQESTNNYAIVNSTLQMTKSLDITVVAEGVETQAVLSSLTDMGCDKAQGYGIAKPMSFYALESYLGVDQEAIQVDDNVTAGAIYH